MKTTRFAVFILIAAIAVLAQRTSRLAGQNNQDNRQAPAALQAAINKELVDGNLDAAIGQYKAIVSKFPKERTVVADALLHLAECYQKVGDPQAQKIYEQVVRDYGDQTAAVTFARAHLKDNAAVRSAKGDRAVWTGIHTNVDPRGRVSRDGRFITFQDWSSGSLMLHDVASNLDRPLTPPTPDYSAASSVISRDGRQVVYLWSDDKNNRMSFRIAATQRSGVPESRAFFFPPDDISLRDSFDWSPDQKWIAAAIKQKDGSGQIVLIGVSDGSLRVLKSIPAPNAYGIFFSPDGKYISYDLPAGNATGRDVFVLARDGSREIPIVRGAKTALGWSPDGTRLLFSSDSSGSLGLWAMSFVDGKAQGSPELLKSDISSDYTQELGLTASGALYLYKQVNTRDIAIAPIDLEAGKLLGPPIGFTQGFLNGSRISQWSPDGKYLAYPVTCNNGCIAIRNLATGQVRRLAPNLKVGSGLDNRRIVSWSPDGRALLARGTEGGQVGIFKIDVQSGETTAVTLGVGTGLSVLAQWSADGRKVYLHRGAAFVERDLATGTEREVYRDEPGVRPFGVLSPDSRYLAVIRNEPDKTFSLLFVPVAGGRPVETLHLMPSEYFTPADAVWTPDSSAVIITKATNSDGAAFKPRELWLVPVTGGPLRKLEIDPDLWMEGNDQSFSLSPDGRSFAFQMGKIGGEIWALENFIPASKTATRGK